MINHYHTHRTAFSYVKVKNSSMHYSSVIMKCMFILLLKKSAFNLVIIFDEYCVGIVFAIAYK